MVRQDFEVLINQAVMHYYDPSIQTEMSSQTNPTVTLAYHTSVQVQGCYKINPTQCCEHGEHKSWNYTMLLYIYNTNSIDLENVVMNIWQAECFKKRKFNFYINGYVCQSLQLDGMSFMMEQIPAHSIVTIMIQCEYKGPLITSGCILASLGLAYQIAALNSDVQYSYENRGWIYQ